MQERNAGNLTSLLWERYVIIEWPLKRYLRVFYNTFKNLYSTLLPEFFQTRGVVPPSWCHQPFNESTWMSLFSTSITSKVLSDFRNKTRNGPIDLTMAEIQWWLRGKKDSLICYFFPWRKQNRNRNVSTNKNNVRHFPSSDRLQSEVKNCFDRFYVISKWRE